MKLCIRSYGCQMSVADAEEMARPWLARGFTATTEQDEADALILSTCTVRQHAEDKAVSEIGRLRSWKEADANRFLIVAGCAAERIGSWIQKRFPHVDLVVGAKTIPQYPQVLEEAVKKRFAWGPENAAFQGQRSAVPAGEGYDIDATHSKASAFVTIMRGCNYSCTYCIVPSVRGRELYRPFGTIVDECRRAVDSGAKEVVLLGQTVNSYRAPTGEDFADLLRGVDGIRGLERIRFMSPHPFYLNEKLVSAMAEAESVAPHLHLPSQSGSNRMLKAMRRNYTVEEFLDRTRALRERIPALQLSTDLIVGFPGESEAEFRMTLDFVGKADFCAAYCFKFSARETTPAAEMDGTIPEPEIERRHEELLRVVGAQTARHLAAMVGTRVKLLLEDETDGRSQFHFKGRLDAPARPGSIVEAEVTGHSPTALKCRALAAAPAAA
jgi:tRNA-2-methylthio-N6-dimethylallyladenosine synthase